jgi:hypothetical protein
MGKGCKGKRQIMAFYFMPVTFNYSKFKINSHELL